jgi:hypothetical protein
MEARSALFRSAAVFSADERIARRLAGGIAGVLILGLLLGSLTLIARRAAGGLSIPLPTAALAATGIIAVAVAAAIRRLGRDEACWSSLHGRVAILLPSFALIALGAAITLPGSPPLGLALLWIAIAAEEAWTWRQWRWVGGRPASRKHKTAVRQLAAVEDGVHPPISRRLISPPLSPSGDVTQRLIRTCSAAGVERIEGWLKAIVHPGERTMHLHVAFCPPFERVPQFTVIQSSGPAARVRPVQLLPYGVRLELKLSEPSNEKAVVVIEFSAEGESIAPIAKA